MTLSVIIPTKNRPHDLARAFASLLTQTCAPAEVLIVDQSATDDSERAITGLYAEAPASVRAAMELRFFRQSGIAGIAPARNFAMDRARGEIWLFLDDDVILEPDHIERLLEAYAAHPEITGCSGVITNYPPPSWKFRLWRRVFLRGPFHDERQPLYWRAFRRCDTELARVNKLGGGLMSFRAAILRSYRSADSRPGVPRAEDIEFCLDLGSQARLAITPRARLGHWQSKVNRAPGDWRHAELAGARRLYERYYRHSVANRARFAWLVAGYNLLGAAAWCRRHAAPLAAWSGAGLLALLLYARVLSGLVTQWWQDPNYGHGFFVPLVAGAMLWQTRSRWQSLPRRPANIGLAFMLAAMLLLWAGTLGAELFVSRVSLLLLLAGAVVFLAGWRWLRSWAFPLGFLLFMIPLPAVIYYQITFPLQILASKVAVFGLDAAMIPVLREGNVIVLPNTTLSVAEACSGIRSLISLLALAVTYGYYREPSRWRRLALALLMVPIAIASNSVRIIGASILAYAFGPRMAEGFFHAFSGWMIFLSAVGLLLLTHRLLRRRPRRSAAAVAQTAPVPGGPTWAEQETA